MLERNPVIRFLSASLATPQISMTSAAVSWAVSPAVSTPGDRADGGVLRDADGGVLVGGASTSVVPSGSGPAHSPASRTWAWPQPGNACRYLLRAVAGPVTWERAAIPPESRWAASALAVTVAHVGRRGRFGVPPLARRARGCAGPGAGPCRCGPGGARWRSTGRLSLRLGDLGDRLSGWTRSRTLRGNSGWYPRLPMLAAPIVGQHAEPNNTTPPNRGEDQILAAATALWPNHG
jgi:hypothetical protein